MSFYGCACLELMEEGVGKKIMPDIDILMYNMKTAKSFDALCAGAWIFVKRLLHQASEE
jgi:hypothetical protein